MKKSKRVLSVGCLIFAILMISNARRVHSMEKGALEAIAQRRQAEKAEAELKEAIGDDLQKANGKLKDDEAVEFVEAIVEASRRFDIDPHLIKGVIITESTVQPEVKNYNGSCIGSMQVSPYWWDASLKKAGIIRSREDYFDIKRGVLAGTYVLDHYIGSTATLSKALERYSGGAKNYYAKVMRNAK